MSMTITCPGCGQITTVIVAEPGEQVWCSGCGSMMDLSQDSGLRPAAVVSSVVFPRIADEIQLRAQHAEERLKSASVRQHAGLLLRPFPRSVSLALIAAGITLVTQAFLSLAPFHWVSWSWFATNGTQLSMLRLSWVGNPLFIGLELGIPVLVLVGWVLGLRWSWAVGRIGSILLAVLIPNMIVANLLRSANSMTTGWQFAGVALLLTLHAIPLIVVFASLGSHPAREHFGLVCQHCGFISGSAGALFRCRITCQTCGADW